MDNDTNNWIQRMRDTGVFPVGSDRPHPQVYIIDRQTGISYEMGGVIPITLPGGEVFECEYRGPHIDFSKPYATCLGSAHTFGRFVTMPYPRLLHERLQQQTQVLNLGYGGVGPEFYLGLPDLLRVANQSMFAELAPSSISVSQTC